MKFYMKNSVKWLILSLMVLSFQSIILAEGDDDKVGSTAFKFLNIKTDAYTASMGGSAAQISGAGAVFSNPSGLASSTGMNFTGGMVQWLVDTKIMNFSFAMPMMGGVVGLSLVNVDYGDMMKSGWGETNGQFVFQPSQGSFTASDVALGASFAKNLSEKFSLGMTAKMISESIEDESFSGFSFDIGTQFNTGYKGIMMGAVISNFGPDVNSISKGEYTYSDHPSMSLPMTFNFGIVGNVFSGFDAGLNVMKYADMEQEFVFNGEYTVADMAALRFSYNMNNPQEPLSFGLGLGVAGVSVDVAITTTQHFDNVMRFGIGYDF